MSKDSFNFFKTAMPESRSADFHLGCLGGSVFIDINKLGRNQISLSRISFDGYGCCELNDKNNLLTQELSERFLNEIRKDEIDQPTMTFIIRKLIEINKDAIWADALEEYNLIGDNHNKR
jgi:hypothetical protein